MVTSNMFIPELRQKQGWRHEKMKLESTQINDSELQELESQTRGRVGGGRGLRHPPPKKTLKFQNTAEKLAADPSGGRSKMMVCKSKHSISGSLSLRCTAGQEEPTHSSGLETPCLKRANRPLE